ncbi:ARM repeat-containing protein [Cystobasidium minutum MCA 4210]|uniref:ARM repeat-containing protein n=1 Tax=Cystobasidium minutum MCA 4210 TaxID=1397322 RepID=UPI0034CFC428|eukprot:jgi/Rhomi1/177596/fgenesh1_pg.1_\
MSNGVSAEDVNSIIQIIQRLHSSNAAPPGLEEQKQLQHALFTAQQAQEAWTLGGQLLSSSNADPNVRFFGAHTLTVKISRDWHTLPEEHWSGLKEAMLGWLSESARSAYPPAGNTSVAGERVVFRKLAVAVTSLSFRLAPNVWPNWLLETILRLTASGCSRLGIYEFLTLAIEEVGRADLVGSKRVQYDQVVSDVAPNVTEMISSSLSSPETKEPAELNAALKCLQSWISKRDINRNLLENVYPLVLRLLPNESTCVNASACVEDILLDGPFATEKRVSPLLDFCASPEVGQIYERAKEEQDVDEVTLALFKLLVAIFEHSYTVIIAELSTPRSIALLQRLLLLTCFPGYHDADEQISDIGLPIWAYLQEEIADNGVVATQSGLGDPRWPIVKDVFDALSNGLRGKVAFPEDREYDSWPKDIKQSFARYRVDVGDCLINAYYVLREPMLTDLVNIATREMQDVVEGRSVEALEATLFCISSIHEAVPMDEETAATQLFTGPLVQTIVGLTGIRYHRLQRTALRLIEEYAPWFKYNASALLPVLQCTVGFLSQEPTSQAAALALSALCDACRKDLIDHVASFAELVRNLEGKIPATDYVRVVGSVAAVIQALPADRLVEPVVVLVENSISKLAAAMSNPTLLASLTACARSLAEPEDEILDLEGLAEATDEEEKAKVVNSDSRVDALRGHLLEAVKAITVAYRGDAEVAQALADFLKACTSTNISTPLSLDPLALADILSHLIVVDFDTTWLSISSLLLFRLRKNPLSASGEITLQAVIGPMEAHPDLVQGFMDWALSSLTSYVAVLATLPQLVQGLIILAVEGLGLQERVGLQKTIQLLTAAVNEAAADSTRPDIASLFLSMMQAHGRSAMERTLAGIGGKLPRSNLGYLAELLLAFSKRMPNETRSWLKELFAQDAFPSRRVSQEQKDRYAKAIMSARSLRKLREATENFAIVCRGLEGTSYAVG